MSPETVPKGEVTILGSGEHGFEDKSQPRFYDFQGDV